MHMGFMYISVLICSLFILLITSISFYGCITALYPFLYSFLNILAISSYLELWLKLIKVSM